ncbi:SRPBCC family protein [Gaoshiqia sediminis]|uniref:SRPBCC family protein n=1 Tax=Gaoshiqia sediminis TaxID=2986998 RepID=A0AA41Y4B3_9BACT|nr:SRPBCC family protein [Gaoshiqia sediminis]MCW0483216.1 SRPBCC family protein [Gaoshiqia sediminis]
MKTRITIVILFLFISGTLLLPRMVSFERKIAIEAPQEVVFNQVNDLCSWGKWSGLTPNCPADEVNYLNAGPGCLAGYSWETSAQTRKVVVTAAAPCDSVLVVMDFMRHSHATTCFRFTEENGTTTVIWQMEADLGNNPLSRLSGLFFNHLLGPDLERGLKKLKKMTEAEAVHRQQIAGRQN